MYNWNGADPELLNNLFCENAPDDIDGNWHAFNGYLNGGVCPGRAPSMWVARFEGLHWDSCQSGTRYAGVLNNYFPVAEVNTYQHVVWTKLGTDYTFYKNGEQFDSVQPAAQNVQLSDNYWIGHVDNYFTGTIDEVGIFDYGLSAEDVAALYDVTSVPTGDWSGPCASRARITSAIETPPCRPPSRRRASRRGWRRLRSRRLQPESRSGGPRGG